MSPIRSLARPLLAAMFIVDGAQALRTPGGRIDAARSAGLSEPDKLVRLNATTMLVGGLGLATGHFARVSALALAATLVPTTVVGHPFWSETDQAAKAAQRQQFLKNLSMLGGLLVAVADTGGRESLPHAAGRISRRTSKQASKRASQVNQQAQSLLPSS